MARQVFFSFHYDRDIWRVNQVRNSKSFKDNDAEVGYYDHSLWERTKLKGDPALQRLIDDGLKGASVTVVLIGARTSTRRWVKYEIKKSFTDGKGLIGIYIHGLKDQSGKTDVKGANPFGLFDVTRNGRKVSLASLCPTYDWVAGDGYRNFASWVEKAAQSASR